MNIPQIDSNFRELDDILCRGYAPTIINTAMELGLFDALFEEPMNVRTLAAKLGTVEDLTEAFANALVALNLLAKTGAYYSLAPLSNDFLVKSTPAYQGGMIAMMTQHGQIMGKMLEILKNDSPNVFNSSMWANADVMKSMGQGVMAGSIQDATEFISTLPEFPDLHRMCDLGGNHGFYTMAMLDKNPQLKGTICDLPEVVKLAEEVISEMGYADRIDTISCDLETDDSIGKGYDLVLASNVLYAWKGHLEDIFERINEAMVPGGVFISNHFSMDDDGCGPVSGTMMELMTRLGGYPTHHLSEEELNDSLAACGFGGFTVKPAEEGRQYRSLILAARKLE
ncbi:MAG: methyltransferase [Euryarchaeota archaeon]|nr:methyltransferase [Euryarchaeota archaeon]